MVFLVPALAKVPRFTKETPRYKNLTSMPPLDDACGPWPLRIYVELKKCIEKKEDQ